MSDIEFESTATMERKLDGSDEAYNRYFFAMYHCMPNEKADLNKLRHRLREQHPSKAILVGRNFVLTGEPAFKVLQSYYFALSNEQSLSDEFRAFAKSRQQAIEQMHKESQSLPVPIDLTEGQLSEDEALEFYASLAINNKQITIKEV